MTNKIEITTPYIELDSFLKFAGVCYTGGEAKIAIKEGCVCVNGEICTMRKKKLYDGDVVGIDEQTFAVSCKG